MQAFLLYSSDRQRADLRLVSSYLNLNGRIYGRDEELFPFGSRINYAHPLNFQIGNPLTNFILPTQHLEPTQMQPQRIHVQQLASEQQQLEMQPIVFPLREMSSSMSLRYRIQQNHFTRKLNRRILKLRKKALIPKVNQLRVMTPQNNRQMRIPNVIPVSTQESSLAQTIKLLQLEQKSQSSQLQQQQQQQQQQKSQPQTQLPKPSQQAQQPIPQYTIADMNRQLKADVAVVEVEDDRDKGKCGRWGYKENYQYLKAYRACASLQEQKAQIEVLSTTIESRTKSQIRAHHQKMTTKLQKMDFLSLYPCDAELDAMRSAIERIAGIKDMIRDLEADVKNLLPLD